MSDSSHPNVIDDACPVPQLEAMLSELRRRWQQGERALVEELSRDFSASTTNSETVLDLIYQEVLLREQAGERPEVDEYLQRFPHLTDELRMQFELDTAIQALHPVLGSASGTSAVGLESGVSFSASKFPVANNRDCLPIIDGYEVLHWIGQGGMAVVFKARHLKLNRPVAIKMMRDHYGTTSTHVRRFLTEAQAAARLQHPHIVQIYEVGRHKSRPFLAYEFLDGGTLGERINGQPIEPRLAANLIETLARTLHFAHQHGVVHRDLKPGNILLQRLTESTISGTSNSGVACGGDLPTTGSVFSGFQLKVADFGLAKVAPETCDLTSHSATKTGDILGTPAYMSPEQARGDIANLTAATDIYALGVMLYELLTGRPPFVGVQPLHVLSQVVADDPVRPSQLVRGVPKDLQTICLKCLEKSTVRRYASAADLAADLNRFLSYQSITARPSSIRERSWHWCRRHPVTSILATSLSATLILIAAISTAWSLQLETQLSLTSEARTEEQSAKVRAQHHLWESYLERAEALRNSGQLGQRYDGLSAINAARDLGKSISLTASQMNRIRNATIACLARPDLRVTRRWSDDWTQFLELSTDDRHSLYGGHTIGNRIVVHRTQDGAEIARINDVSMDCISRISPDGTKLAVLDDNCRVFRIDTVTPELIFESARTGDWRFAPDSQQILGADGYGKLVIVDLQEAKVIRTVCSLTALHEISISPDASRAALFVDDAVQVVELDSGKVSFQSDGPVGPGGSQHLAWHPNSMILAIGQYPGEGIVVWDVAKVKKLTVFDHRNGNLSFCFSSTGDLLLLHDSWGGHMQLYNFATGEVELSKLDIHVFGIKADTTGGFRMLQELDDNQFGSVVVEDAGIYRTLPRISTTLPTLWSPHLSYSPDGRLLAVAASGEIQLVDAETLTSLDRLETGESCVRFDIQNSLLTLTQSGLFRWRPGEIELAPHNSAFHEVPARTFGPPEKLRMGAYDSDFDINFKASHITLPDGNGVLVCDINNATPPRSIGPHPDVRSVSFSSDGSQLATGGWNGGNACIWDVDSGQLLHTIDQPACCTVQFSPDGKWLVTNAKDVTVWHANSWIKSATLDVPGQSVSGVTVCFTPDSSLLAVSDSTARIHLFRPEDGSEFITLTDPNLRVVRDMAFNPMGNQLAVVSGDRDAVVHVWDLFAIRDELTQRDLSWMSENNSSASSVVNVSKPLGSVAFVPDEQFLQMEVVQQVRRASLAAEEYDIDAARAAIRRAVELQPKHAESCNSLAWLLTTGPVPLRDATIAVTLARRAMQDGSLTDVDRLLFLNTLGVALYRAGQIDEAVETLRKSVANQSPENQPFDLFFLSMCHARRGDQTTARDFLRRAEALVEVHSAKMPQTWRQELAQFAEEAGSLLNTIPKPPAMIPRAAETD